MSSTDSSQGTEIHLLIKGANQGVIQGESTAATHANEIEVAGFSWGMHGPVNSTTGGAAGRASLNHVSITKYVDKATCKLMTAALNREMISSATVSWSKSTGGTTTQDFFTVTLTNGTIVTVNINSGASAGGKGMGTEVLTISFQSIKMEYKQQGASGLMTSAGQSMYDLGSGSGN